MTKPTKEQIDEFKRDLMYYKMGNFEAVLMWEEHEDFILTTINAYKQSQEVDADTLKEYYSRIYRVGIDPNNCPIAGSVRMIIDDLAKKGYLRQPQEKEVSEVHNPELTKLLQSPSVIERDNSEALEALENISESVDDILSLAYKNSVTELAKFKFKEDVQTIRNYIEGK